MAVVTELLALLKLDSKNFDSGMKKAKKTTKDFGGNIKSAGNNIRDFGNKMTLATAPIALGLGVAINQARTFDKSMANINAILGITGTEAEDLRKELLEYGGASRQGPQQVAEAYYDIVSGVQDATTHMAILDAATRTADAGQANLKATTSSLISTMNSYGFAAEDAAHVSDVFTRTVGMGVLTMDELASAMPQVTGLAASLGISIDDLGGQMAFLTAQGFSASNSATFLKAMMTTLLNPTADLQVAMADLGFESGEAMIANLGLVGSYEALKQYNQGTFSGLITNQEALQGATALTKDTFGEFNATFQETIAGSTDAAKAIQDEEASWDLLGAKLQETAITVGDQLAPVLMALIDEAILPAITAVTDWMAENPELTNQLVLMAGAAVVLGPVISAVGTAVSVVTGIVGVATTAWGVLSAGWSALVGLSTAVTGALSAVGGTMLATVGPILAVGAAIAGVILELRNFINTVNTAKAAAQSALADEIASGAVTRQNLDDAAFGAVSAQFGGGILGDVIARATYSNFADAVEGRAAGGGVAGGSPYMVGEQGPELFVPDTSGEVVPNDRAMGSVQINVYQMPGEDGVMLASRIQRKMVQMGLARA